MKIIVAEHFGMCFGVRDAIAQAQQLAREGPLTILGQLVHNPIVRERLRAAGARESADLPDDGAQVMITAHGASDRRHAQLRARGLTSADGTCPLVRRAHHQLKALVATGYFPIVIGQRGHVEVRGLTEDFTEACVIEGLSEIHTLPLSSRYGVIAQTTQPIDHVREIAAEIARVHPAAEVRFVDTVCQPTKDRQRALVELIAQTDLIVVVGGRESNNTRQLFATCHSLGRNAIQIERAEELRAEWFNGVERVGLTAGTSTLNETVEAVHHRLLEFAK